MRGRDATGQGQQDPGQAGAVMPDFLRHQKQVVVIYLATSNCLQSST